MNYNEYISYASEIEELKSFLGALSDDNLLDRIGFEARLKKAQEAIKGIDKPTKPLTALLTFSGKPVHDQYSVEANFVSHATELFTNAVASIAGKNHQKLRVTNIARGSFGFELEIPPQDETELFNEASPTEKAVEDVKNLFKLSLNDNDDAFSELAEDIPTAALKKTEAFLEYLSKSDARCGIGFKGDIFKFHNEKQLQTSLILLQESDNEEPKKIKGQFSGFLPLTTRRFEFVPAKEEEKKFSGKLDIPDLVPEKVNSFLNKDVCVTFQVRTVGNRKPTYRLESLEDIELL